MSVVGNATIIGKQAHFDRSVSWSDCYVGEKSVVSGSTIADRNIIKDHVVVSEGSVIGSGCTIGSGAVVRPNIKLWPDKSVTSGAIVSMSLIYGIKWPGSLFGGTGVSGLANVEITPSFALALGQAYGSHLKQGQTAFSSRDAHPAARMLNRCIISGLLSVGVNVEDQRAIPLPLARYSVRTGGDGGIHTRVDPHDPNSVLIEVLDANGVNIDKNTERKIENLFFREDFRRTAMDEVGQLSFPSRSLELYTTEFLQALKPRALPAAKFRVVVDYGYGNASIVLPRILSNLGVDIVALDAYYDEAKARTFRDDRERYLEQLRTVTLTLGADLGVLVDHDGESFALIDDQGRIIAGNRLLALVTLMIARAKPGARIAVPITTPNAIERLATSLGATITRTRSDRRSMMALAQAERDTLDYGSGFRQEPIFPEVPAGLRRALRDRQDHGDVRRRRPQAPRAQRSTTALVFPASLDPLPLGTQGRRHAHDRRPLSRPRSRALRRRTRPAERRLVPRAARRFRSNAQRLRRRLQRRRRRPPHRRHRSPNRDAGRGLGKIPLGRLTQLRCAPPSLGPDFPLAMFPRERVR